MIEKVNQVGSVQAPGNAGAVKRGGERFGSMLSRRIQEKEQPAQTINFSKHAMARAQERGIELTDELMDRLAGSVEKAREKGAANIVAFDATQAFIINIPYGRVITTMSQDEMRQNIFTNIDGAVLL